MTPAHHPAGFRTRRLQIVIAGFALAATAISWRLVDLQWRESERFRERARQQHQRRVVVEATRGAILDRDGRPLAVSVRRKSLFAHPRRLSSEQAAQAAELLAPILNSRIGPLLDKLHTDRSFVWLGRTLEPDVVAAVEASALDLGGDAPFGFLEEPKRRYPKGRLAGHVVGFAGIDGHGLEGIERTFDHALSGDPTVYLSLRDGRQSDQLFLVQQPTKQPQDVVLTLDLDVQHIVERALDDAMRRSGAQAASGIVLDPRTGDVLALANRPDVDPNSFGRADEDARRNRAIQAVFEPGSTFKMVPLAAALERNRTHATEQFDCKGGRVRRGRRTIKDVGRNRRLTVAEILAKSSNVGMVQIAERLTADELYATIRDFGFGRRTGIELPGEAAGLIRKPGDWSAFSQDSLSFGQELGVNVVQMASMLGVLANDGVQVAPRLVRSVRDGGRHERQAERPRPRRIVSDRTAEEIRSMMELVVTRGSGKRARVEGFRIAGKSGTAQIAVAGGYSPDRYMASFGGFGPVDDPRAVVIVVLDSPRGHWIHGGDVAAPIFAEIMRATLLELRAPQDADLLPHPQTTADLLEERLRPVAEALPASQSGRMPSLIGLSSREAVAILNRLGHPTVIRGSGYVVDQQPAAGSTLSAGETCTVRMRDAVSALRRRRAS